MFERRLRIVLSVPIICGAIIIARLCQLQILNGDEYVRRAEASLMSPRRFLPPLRGRILDRFGRVLVADEPAHDVTVHYGILSMDRAYLLRWADRIRREEPPYLQAADAAIEDEVRRRLAKMWSALARVSGVSMKEFRRRRDAICDSVERLRRHIWKARRAKGFEVPLETLRLAEEDLFHPILRDVSPTVRTRIELELSHLPCVRVAPSVRRVWGNGREADGKDDGTASLCHILGRLGQASTETIRNDPLRDDWLACYRAGDRAGISGIERLGEQMLRGKRGFEEKFRDGRPKRQVPPIDGLDVQLTIDLDLQQRVVEILATAVAEHPPSTGASCVVIDVVSREILALVSVPTYDRQTLSENYAALRDDAQHRPLLFRAVSEEYQPGSILKPVALLAGLAEGTVDPDETAFCDGRLIPGVDKWHCWTYWRGLPGHGYLAAEEAIQHSCNVYFYGLGQRLGAERLTEFYRRFIAPRGNAARQRLGTGLIEERRGIIPTKQWMQANRKRRFRPADGRNYAIGQGEIQLTPLQAANAFATIATGAYRDPAIVANDLRDRPVVPIEVVPESAWRLTRRGLYRCVNEQGGTAYHYARVDAVEICGKTGSAQCVPRVVLRRFTFRTPVESPHDGDADSQPARATGVSSPDSRVGIPASVSRREAPRADGTELRSVVAPTVEAARERLGLRRDIKPVQREIVERHPRPDPETGKVPTHAWFAGFAPYRSPRIALAVVIEHGGSGGRTAGPVAREVFEAILESPRGYLAGGRKTNDEG